MTNNQILALAKDPGSRSRIPTAYLPAQYKAIRQRNAANAQPVVPGSSETVGQAAQERNAAVEQKYGDAIRSSQAQVAAIPQWYQQFRQQQQIAQQAQQAGYQQAVQAFQGLQAGTQANQGQADVASYQQQAAQLGQVADPAAQARAAQAAAIRGASVGDLGSVLAAQGASQAAYGAQQQNVAGQSQVEALQRELDNQRQLQVQKGAFATQTDADIKDREQKNVLENAAFNLNVANTQADNQRQDQQLQANESDKRKQRQIQRQNQNLQTAGPGGTYSKQEWASMTPEQRTKAVADYKKATAKPGATANGKTAKEPATSLQPRRVINARVQFVQKYLSDNKLNLNGPAQRAQVVASLRKTHPGFFDNGNNEKSLSAALDIAQSGKISSGNLAYLRKQGVYVASNGAYAPATNH